MLTAVQRVNVPWTHSSQWVSTIQGNWRTRSKI